MDVKVYRTLSGENFDIFETDGRGVVYVHRLRITKMLKLSRFKVCLPLAIEGISDLFTGWLWMQHNGFCAASDTDIVPAETTAILTNVQGIWRTERWCFPYTKVNQQIVRRQMLFWLPMWVTVFYKNRNNPWKIYIYWSKVLLRGLSLERIYWKASDWYCKLYHRA